jgi:hypothetical protein
MMTFVFVALFSKEQLQPVIKEVVPALTPCFNEAGRGAANLRLAFDGTPARLTVTLKDIEGDPVAEDVRTCVRATLASLSLPPIGDGGTGELLYPFTYDIAPPDNHDIVDYLRAQRAAEAKQWGDALVAAEAALKLTSLDGKHRRLMIRIAGIAACHLDASVRAAKYETLASPENAAAIRAACR